MAVYTAVSPEEAGALLRRIGLGRLERLEGIRSGIENTNYFAWTDRGEWVVTLFERLPRERLPWFMQLMRHLAGAGLPVPHPQGDGDVLVHTLAGKPAAVVSRLRGTPVMAPDERHCAGIGALLGRLHVAGAGFGPQQDPERGLPWWESTMPQVLPHLAPPQAALLREELAFQRGVAGSPQGRALPRGPVPGDLFRDNAMFEDTPGGPRASGVLDFYFAGTDSLLFDVAVCLNDWCIDDATGALDPARASALLEAYLAQRPWAPGERALLPAMLRAAALRFWLSRLADWHLPRQAELLVPKDPVHFEHVLRQRVDNPPSLPA